MSQMGPFSSNDNIAVNELERILGAVFVTYTYSFVLFRPN